MLGPVLVVIVLAAVTGCVHGLGASNAYGNLIAPLLPGVLAVLFQLLASRRPLRLLFVAPDHERAHSMALSFLISAVPLGVMWVVLCQSLQKSPGPTAIIMAVALLGALILAYCLRFIRRPSGWDVYALMLAPSAVTFLAMPLAIPNLRFHFAPAAIGMNFLMNTLAALVSEELCFRGYVVGVLGRFATSSWAWSAVAFALYHVPFHLASGVPVHKLWLTLLGNGINGLAFAVLFSRTGNLAYPAVAHGLANGLRAGFRPAQ